MSVVMEHERIEQLCRSLVKLTDGEEIAWMDLGDAWEHHASHEGVVVSVRQHESLYIYGVQETGLRWEVYRMRPSDTTRAVIASIKRYFDRQRTRIIRALVDHTDTMLGQ